MWIATPQARPNAALRLIAFPYAGAGALAFREWATALPDALELVTVQLPGRENRLKEAPFRALAPLMAALVPALAPTLQGKPYALYGHSMGARIAFALARAAHADPNLPSPTALFVSGRVAPHLPDPLPPIHALPEAELLDEMVRRYAGIPDALRQNAELRALFVPLLRADLAVIETAPPSDVLALPFPISAFAGLQDASVAPKQVNAWGAHTRAEFRFRTFEGDHFFIHPQRNALQAAILHDLGR